MDLDDGVPDELEPKSEEELEQEALARQEEAEKIEETDNSPRPEDGPQPPQDEDPALIPEGKTNQPDEGAPVEVTPEAPTQETTPEEE